MPRIARVVVPGLPHHITQRGNRRQKTFFLESDYRLYLDLLARYSPISGVNIWAYCLMPNHVHIIAVPNSSDSFHRLFSEAHKRYSRAINFRQGWRGHLWQGRFASFPMDTPYLHAALNYVEFNPVAAGIVKRPEDYLWSSAAARILGRPDGITDSSVLNELREIKEGIVPNPVNIDSNTLKIHEHTGRPLGDDMFISDLEIRLGRKLRKQRPGPKVG